MSTTMKKYLFILAAAATMAACSNDDGLSAQATDTAGRDIVFETDVPGITRSMANGLTNYGAGDDKFYIWADQMELVEGTYTEHTGFIDAWNFTTTAVTGRLTNPNVVYKWPTVNRLRFYAIHGNFSGANSAVTANDSPFPKATLTEEEAAKSENLGPLRHTVPTLQVSTQEGRNNYQYADLLYAVVPTTGYVAMVPLHFYHLMSKVVVQLRKGEGITLEELQWATVKIVKVKNQVDFLPKKLTVTVGAAESGRLSFNAAELTNADTRTAALKGMLSLPEQSLVDIDLRVLQENGTQVAVSTTDLVTQPEWAIVVPQQFADDSEAAIEISWKGKTVRVPLKGQEFEAGKQYTYNITLNHVGTSYGFSPTVSTWGEEEERAIDVKSGS